MATANARRSAAAAARELMNGKIKVVEDLAASLDDWRTATAAVEAAAAIADTKAADARAAHEKARTSGWTAAELRDLDLEPPAAPRKRRTATDPANGDAAGDTVNGGDAARSTTASASDDA